MFLRHKGQPEMMQKVVRTKYGNPENNINRAQDQKCYETSEEADNGFQDSVLHDSGENST
jgi:hypothetical protein